MKGWPLVLRQDPTTPEPAPADTVGRIPHLPIVDLGQMQPSACLQAGWWDRIQQWDTHLEMPRRQRRRDVLGDQVEEPRPAGALGTCLGWAPSPSRRWSPGVGSGGEGDSVASAESGTIGLTVACRRGQGGEEGSGAPPCSPMGGGRLQLPEPAWHTHCTLRCCLPKPRTLLIVPT